MQKNGLMDNDKLSTIIKDTEANLMRLKQQYRSREQQISPHKYGGGSSYHSPPLETEASGNRGSSLLFGFLNQIKGQLDEQSQSLQKMNSSIQKLEAENSHYKQELMTAHSNVLQLSSLLDNERRKTNLSLERHLIQMQEMLCTELKRMSKEINELKLKCAQPHYSASPESNYSEASRTHRKSKKSSQSSIHNDIYEDALKLYRKDKKRTLTPAASESQYSSSLSNVQQITRLRGCESASCFSHTPVSKTQISPVNSIHKIPPLARSHKKIQDKLARLVASGSKMSSTSSTLDSSSNQTISSSRNLTLQSDEEDLHSDDSNFGLLDSRSIGKSEDDLGSSSAEDLMSECESLCSEKLS